MEVVAWPPSTVAEALGLWGARGRCPPTALSLGFNECCNLHEVLASRLAQELDYLLTMGGGLDGTST